MAIEWKNEYSVNVIEIDEQHKIFFSIINELYSAMYSGKTHEKMELILEELSNYGKYHFKTEEVYFGEFDFEFKLEHTKQHNDFIDRVNEFVKDFVSHKKDISTELIDFLENWIVGHIYGADKKYTKCFNDHGLF